MTWDFGGVALPMFPSPCGGEIKCLSRRSFAPLAWRFRPLAGVKLNEDTYYIIDDNSGFPSPCGGEIKSISLEDIISFACFRPLAGVKLNP